MINPKYQITEMVYMVILKTLAVYLLAVFYIDVVSFRLNILFFPFAILCNKNKTRIDLQEDRLSKTLYKIVGFNDPWNKPF